MRLRIRLEKPAWVSRRSGATDAYASVAPERLLARAGLLEPDA